MDEEPQRLPVDFIWSNSGQKHIEYSNGESFQGELGTYLGQVELGEGGQATVRVVIVNGQAIAQKGMRLEAVDEEARREAAMLESIVHRHVVQLLGTYIQSRRLFLLLFPIAECTLREYITRPIELRNITWEKEVRECFGCLANTVAFLHSKQVAIKHKDIKPSNVLMFQGIPVLTDFGISNSFRD